MMTLFGIPWHALGLLTLASVLMTFSWYGHLKYAHAPLWQAVLASWLLALVAYCVQVPANRASYGPLTATQIKVVYEAISLLVFSGVSVWFFKESLHWNHWVGFILLIGAVYFVTHKF
ncbi:MAG: DMT family protein [Vampirovibrionales bacterium]|nr:DMT family protein [Vampirovibrionales bacterium]